MKQLYLMLFLCVTVFIVFAQANPAETARIRQQMAKIRQTTDWNDPAAAKKANAEIQKLANQLTGGKSFPVQFTNQPADSNVKHENINYLDKTAANKQNVVAIADRFFKRSYKTLIGTDKFTFDQDFKVAEKEKFSLGEVRKLANKGAFLILFGNDHNLACAYLAAAVRAFPADTLSVNNFGGYLRTIDSVETSIPVLLYANSLFSESPVILTQLGCSYFELKDFVKAEKYLKAAIEFNPDFGQAHTALCELYIQQGRLKDAIMELFSGVKGMGASYMDASNKFASIQQGYESKSGSGDDFESKEEFWDETKKNVPQPGETPQNASEIGKVKMPGFPDCPAVADWMEGGGYSAAVMAYQGFMSEAMAFAKRSLKVQNEIPSLPPDAILRDYPNERFALDCITEMFLQYSNQESKKYSKSMDEISQRANDAKEQYLKEAEGYSKEYSECIQACSSEYCLNECHRKFCARECPNANKFNDILRQAYNDYRITFSHHTSQQKKFLDDLYGYANPWLSKIYSPYWSKVYACEVKRVALGIVGSCYGAYPYPFQFPAHNNCGTDCSVYANPAPPPPDGVSKKDPEANSCPENSKFKVSLAICELGLDCESIEFGCTALASGSVKRNFKRKNTTFFVGVGMKGGLGVVEVGAKAGATVTVDDHNEIVDVGGKVDLTANVKVGASKIGATATGSITVMTGLSSKVGVSGGIFKPGN